MSEFASGRILIVDDQAYNRDLLSFMLEDNGYTSVKACNGLEAVNLMASDESIDLVLMDVSMPVMDGFEAARRIKANMADRFQPIVFVTALDDDETLAKCLSVGGDDFIPKPINESVLLAKVAANQRTARLYRELQKSNASLLYHRKLMDREHAIVEHVFQNGMKRVDMDCKNIRFSTTPMSMFNGDLMLTTPNPSGGVYVLLGDFTGHGLSAAIGCLPVADIFYAMTKKHADVGAIAYEMNLRLQSLLPAYMFFCAAILELSVNGDRLSYWVGGMNDILLVSEGGGIVDRLRAQHMPLGVLDAQEFDASVGVVTPASGTRVFAYTDGVIEVQNHQGQAFGEERLESLFQEPRDSYVEYLSESLLEFQDEQSDDISFVELVCSPVVFGNPEAVEAFVEVPPAATRLPWRFELNLGPEELKRGDIVTQLLRLIANETSLSAFKDPLFTIFSELYNNALDHGILQLDSNMRATPEGFSEYYQLRQELLQQLQAGEIKIALQLTGDSNSILEITVTDSGKGFSEESRRAGGHVAEGDMSFGLGILIARALCESLVYSDAGRTATARFSLAQD